MENGSPMPENQHLSATHGIGFPSHVHLNFSSSEPPSVFFNYGAYNDYRNTHQANVGPYSRPNNSTMTESPPQSAEGHTEGILLQ
jgi:hypothetical protein